MQKPAEEPLLTLKERSASGASRLVILSHPKAAKHALRQAIVRCGVALARRVRKTVRMILAAEPHDLLSYVPKRDKVVEGMLLLLERARADDFAITTETMVTAMFLADKGHLDAYGRPVFFDNYVATANGPAGVAATEMLDPVFDWSTCGMDAAPWISEMLSEGPSLRGTRAPNLRRLSQTDVEALTNALAMVAALDVRQLRLFTHRQTAYAAAWRNGEGSRLDPRLVIDERDDDLIDDLLYASRHAYNAPRRP